MRLPLFIAKRYLFAHKSHNVINIISAISAIGMAIGTAALIIILSIYNGFDSLVRTMMSSVEPDLLISPKEGKYFTPEGEVYDWLYDNPSVASICTVLQDQVFLTYGGQQCIAMAKGVDSIYEDETPVRDHIVRGEFSLHKGDIPQACVGSGLAYKMGMNPHFLTPIVLYYPSGDKKLNILNPMSGLSSCKVWPSGVFAINSDIDASTLIIPMDQMSRLLNLKEGEVSGVEIRLAPTYGSDKTKAEVSGSMKQSCEKVKIGKRAKINGTKQLQKELQKRLGDQFIVKDRYMQNESLYKMMKYEKAIIFLILIFVVIIVSFNIFGSLSMLIIEKKEDIMTIRAMGGTPSLIRRIFTMEGWLVSLLGMAAGTVIGLAIAWLQQEFGFVKMPGNFAVSAYPVIVDFADVAATILCISIIGLVTAAIPAAKAAKY